MIHIHVCHVIQGVDSLLAGVLEWVAHRNHPQSGLELRVLFTSTVTVNGSSNVNFAWPMTFSSISWRSQPSSKWIHPTKEPYPSWITIQFVALSETFSSTGCVWILHLHIKGLAVSSTYDVLLILEQHFLCNLFPINLCINNVVCFQRCTCPVPHPLISVPW
jgi:hypothetical protein